MAVRSFEEQVRAELGALRFTPDEQVWLHVEAALHKERKRRWLIWLFAGLLAGGALGGIYYQYQQNNTPAQTENLDHTRKENGTAVLQNAIDNNRKEKNTVQEKDERVEAGVNAGRPVAGTIQPEENKTRKSSDQRRSQKNNIDNAIPEKTYTITRSALDPVTGKAADQPKTKTTTTYRDPGVLSQPIDPPLTGSQKTDQPLVVDAPTKTNETIAQTDPVKPGSTDKSPMATPMMDSAKQNNATDATTVVITNNKKKTPWRLFGVIDLGGSKEVMPPAMRFSSVAAAAPPSNAIPGNSNGMYSNGATYKEPVRSGGFSYGLNLQAIKTIGKSTDIGLGLGYQFYQTKITVGQQMSYMQAGSTRLDNFYLSSDSSSYKNNWHFAAFEFDFYQRINMGGSTVLRWRLGLGANLLLASNALYYNKSTAVLYEDEETRNKVQFNLSTGFDLGFGKQQSFYIGPQFTYFVTPSSTNLDYRFFRTALRASFALPKKKK